MVLFCRAWGALTGEICPQVDLEAIRKSYLESVTRIQKQADEQFTKLNARYMEGLAQQEDRATQAAELDAVLSLKKEQQHMLEAGRVPAIDENVAPSVVAARKWYRGHQERILTRSHDQRKKLFVEYDTRLKAMQNGLTRNRNVPDAVLVQQYREEIKKDMATIFASAPPPPEKPAVVAAPVAPAKPAADEMEREDDIPFSDWIVEHNSHSPWAKSEEPRVEISIVDGDTQVVNSAGGHNRLCYPKILGKKYDFSVEARTFRNIGIVHADGEDGGVFLKSPPGGHDEWHSFRIRNSRAQGLEFLIDGEPVEGSKYTYSSSRDHYFGIAFTSKIDVVELRNLNVSM